jgi:fumarylpyruvate hydrolase
MPSPRTVDIRGESAPLTVGKIIALGRNYAAHAREMGVAPAAAPVIFLKPASALVRPGGEVRRPSFSLQLHHEVELVVAIGRGGVRIAADDALQYVLGYGVGLDMTLRDVQAEAKRRGHPWTVAKGFDTAAPVSEIVPAAEIGDPAALRLELAVNGELRQAGAVSDMILPVPEIIAHVSQVFTLDRGDLIFTGTPEGVGAVFPGERLTARLVGHVELSVLVEESAGTGSEPPGGDE